MTLDENAVSTLTWNSLIADVQDSSSIRFLVSSITIWAIYSYPLARSTAAMVFYGQIMKHPH